MPSLFGNNPMLASLDRYLDPRRGQLLALAAGLSSSPDLGQAVSNGFAGAAQARPADAAYMASKAADAARQQQINQTAEWVKKNYPQFGDLPPDQGFQLAAQLQGKTEAANVAQPDPADVATYKFYANQEIQAGHNPKSFADWTAGTRPGIKGSLGPPLSFIDPTTKQIHPVQKFTDGSTIDLTTGQPPDPGLTYDPYSTSAAQAGGSTDATNAAVARNLLPGAEQSYGITQQALKNFDPNNMDPNAVNVRQGEGENFAKVFGFIPNQMIKAIVPGTPRANFYNVINQLSGDAFLNVRQALKGAGQVTDFEGVKGEQAISRMKAAADNGDDAAFRRALTDFSTAMENGLRLLREQAQGKYAAGVVPGLAGGASPAGGQTYTYNPATGQLE